MNRGRKAGQKVVNVLIYKMTVNIAWQNHVDKIAIYAEAGYESSNYRCQ